MPVNVVVRRDCHFFRDSKQGLITLRLFPNIHTSSTAIRQACRLGWMDYDSKQIKEYTSERGRASEKDQQSAREVLLCRTNSVDNLQTCRLATRRPLGQYLFARVRSRGSPFVRLLIDKIFALLDQSTPLPGSLSRPASEKNAWTQDHYLREWMHVCDGFLLQKCPPSSSMTSLA